MTSTYATQTSTLSIWWNESPSYVREGILSFLTDGSVPPCVIGDMVEENGGDRDWTGALLSWASALWFADSCQSLAYRAGNDRMLSLDCTIQGENTPWTIRIGFRYVGQRMRFEDQLRKGMKPSWLKNWANENMGEFTFA